MKEPWLVAAVQMVSGDDVAENLAQARALVTQAAAQGAKLVVLPEYFCLLSPQPDAKFKAAEAFGRGPIQDALASMARDESVWLVGGTMPLQTEDTGRVTNSQLVYGPDGELLARYDKIHLFNYHNERESYDEAQAVKAGQDVVVLETALGRIGLSTCYDLRFPELYRAMGSVDVIVVPSAFTTTTGQAHWEPLLRARAIENQAYVVASAQGGEHPGGRQTWGHSMVIDPWGEIMAEMELGAGLVVSPVKPERLQAVRAALPALKHRVIGID